MAEKPREWPHEDQRKDHALRESVDNLLQHTRDVHGRLRAMGNDDVEAAQRRFLKYANMIWERLLQEEDQEE